MPLRGAHSVKMWADFRAAISRLGRAPEIAAGDSGSHFPVQFSRRIYASNASQQVFFCSGSLPF